MLTLRFDVDSGSGFSPGSIGKIYRSGDEIRLSINASSPCYMLVFGIDTSGPYGIWPDSSLVPGRFDPQSVPHELRFALDDELGSERIVAIARN